MASLLSSFGWLEAYGKLPTDFGVTWDQVDPCWEAAMMTVKGALERQRSAKAERQRIG